MVQLNRAMALVLSQEKCCSYAGPGLGRIDVWTAERGQFQKMLDQRGEKA
ncbi:MAG TPA: hypothetical protein IAA51_04985 [Candidatus Cottocaccamicrobium excrementipullorum]|nr:hypothetical protein [Candidatus Cottocaccamicrobium excrementipullorum]